MANYTSHSSNLTVSGETLNLFSVDLRFYIHYAFLLPISMLGIFGNSITMVVFWRIKNKSPYHCFIQALSLFDLIYCCCIFGKVFARMNDVVWRIYYIYVYYFSMKCVAVCSYFTVLMLSAERLMVVTWPLRSRPWLQKRKPKSIFALMTIVVVLVVLCHVPYLYGPLPASDGGNGTTFVTETKEAVFEIQLPYFRIVHACILTLTKYVPIILVFIFNVIVIVMIKRQRADSAKLQQRSDSKDTDEAIVTRMLLCMAIVFLICICIDTGGPSVEHALYVNYDTMVVKNVYFEIAAVFALINHSINFLIYILWTNKYRQAYRDILCCCTGRGGESLEGSHKRNISTVTGSRELAGNSDMPDVSTVTGSTELT